MKATKKHIEDAIERELTVARTMDLKPGDPVTILFSDGDIMDVGSVRLVRGDEVLIDGPTWSDRFSISTGQAASHPFSQPGPTFRRATAADVDAITLKREASKLREEIRHTRWDKMDLSTLRQVAALLRKVSP